MVNHNADPNEVARAYELAADAAEDMGRDATGTARYNSGRMAEAAELAVLREFDERAVWGEVCETIDAVGRPGANAPLFRGRVIEDVLRRCGAEIRARAEEGEDEDEHVVPDEELVEELERGERVEVRVETDEGEDGTPETLTFEGTVCKSNRGGIRVLPDNERRLYTVKRLGTVSKVHPDGGALRLTSRVGRNATVKRTGETRNVVYEQRSGWTHTDA